MRPEDLPGLFPPLLFAASHSIPGWTPGDPPAERARVLVERSAGGSQEQR